MAERWNRVERLVRAGSAPPIEVYELDRRYFVIDGHHRVAVARQRGIDHVEAVVTRLRTRLPLLQMEPARPRPERRLSA
jgi:ParB-like chromosome segregation protein Spo0J